MTATRSELLERRGRLALARRGRNLLDEKRDQLMEAFRAIADDVLAGQEALDAAAAEARRHLVLAEALDGPAAARSAALAGRAHVELDTRTTTIMGVRIAEIDSHPLGRSRFDRGYTLAGSSPRIDAAAESFETELELVLELATRELRLRRLVDEIATTTRRVNALEYVVIPSLQREAAQIQSVLDERERQDRFRLKRVKQRRTAPRRRR